MPQLVGRHDDGFPCVMPPAFFVHGTVQYGLLPRVSTGNPFNVLVPALEHEGASYRERQENQRRFSVCALKCVNMDTTRGYTT